jgi:hypothetical protein
MSARDMLVLGVGYGGGVLVVWVRDRWAISSNDIGRVWLGYGTDMAYLWDILPDVRCLDCLSGTDDTHYLCLR